ncbi:FAD-dependent monooxygenase [Aestuariivirga sp.]|jgi:salicylate hydroxylase|uniref:FAD-dependent monooxygenase n=1 Tax=Aestuariivirga sp. TaxID=2650926 RepID=UPI00378476CA
MSELPVLVAGGGIAGLAAALGLSRQGHAVRLFEQAPAFSEVGAGLQMSPNGVRALRALGAWEAVEPSCVVPSEIHVRDGMSGRVLQRVRLGKPFEQRFGAPYRVCHRADLLAGLLEAGNGRTLISLEPGQTVESAADAGERVRINLAGGMDVQGKALVIADGIRSRLRSAICGPVAPVDRRLQLYRALIAFNAVPPGIAADCVTLWLYPGAHVVHYPVSNWQRFNIVIAVDDCLTPAGAAGWQAPATAADVRGGVPDACADLASLLALEVGWQRWSGADLPDLPRWSSGALTLIGDAAHATLPFLAQGAMMALEDAVVLSKALSREPLPASAFAAYEQARRPRTRRIQAESRRMGRTYHAKGALAMARNLALWLAGPSFALDRLDWIYRWMPPWGD